MGLASPHDASERADVHISVGASACGFFRARVRYIVRPSGEKAVTPSSASVLSSPSAGIGRCQRPCSSLVATHMSARFVPVTSERAVPVTFSLVVVK